MNSRLANIAKKQVTQLCVALFFLMAICLGCATTADHNTQLQVKSYAELKTLLGANRPDIKTFIGDGPFSYKTKKDFKIRISDDAVVNADLYLSDHDDKGPLAIIQHGNNSGKSYHENQARHLASWGIHTLVLDLPNQKKWMKNAETIYRLTRLLAVWPDMIGKKFDPEAIIGIGHSFGGSAISIAAGKGAPFQGIILLDPAVISDEAIRYIAKIKTPVILLGADQDVFRSRQRTAFFRNVKKNIAEISVKDATHNDAQYPEQFVLSEYIGLTKSPSGMRQRLFSSAILTSVMSLNLGGDADYAWSAFKPLVAQGLLIHPQRK